MYVCLNQLTRKRDAWFVVGFCPGKLWFRVKWGEDVSRCHEVEMVFMDCDCLSFAHRNFDDRHHLWWNRGEQEVSMWGRGIGLRRGHEFL